MTRAPTNTRRRRTTALSATAAAVVLTNLGVGAAPASAECDGGSRPHYVNTWRSDAMLQGAGKATNVGSGNERWCDLRTEEEYAGPWILTPQVCDYQGAVYVYNPDGSSADRSSKSSYHGGCSWGGWFYHDSLDGTYAENKRFRTKWRSDATGGDWQTIGTLTD